MLDIVKIQAHDRRVMSKSDAVEFNSVADFMKATGMNDNDLAEYLDVDRSEATRLRQGRRFRSLTKPLRISRKCKVRIERLAPESAA